MKDFRKLDVWVQSHQLTLALYTATQLFPREELYGITSQTRRAGASIPTNIAEGCGRGSDADFRRFLIMAMGSASELEYHLILARDLSYVNSEDFDELNDHLIVIKKMLNNLIKKIKTDLS